MRKRFLDTLSATALRRGHPRVIRRVVRPDDDPHERCQHVRHGAGHAHRARLEHQLQHLGGRGHSGTLRHAGRAAVGHHQRSAAVRAHLGRRRDDPDPGTHRGRRLDEPEGADRRQRGQQRLHPHVDDARQLQGQPDGRALDRYRLRARLRHQLRLLDDGPPGRAACAQRKRSARGQAGADHRCGVQDGGAVHRYPARPAGVDCAQES